MTRFAMILVLASAGLGLHRPAAAAGPLRGCPAVAGCSAGLGTIVGPAGNALRVCPQGCPYGTIQAAIDAARTGDTISVAAGTYKENLIFFAPLAAKTLQLRGAGASATIVDGDQQNCVLQIEPDYTVSVTGMSFTNGRCISAGGIINQGALTLIRVAVSHNQGDAAGGIGNDSLATLKLFDVIVNDNIATSPLSGQGGGLLNAGTATLTDSVVTGNTAMAFAGGIQNRGELRLVHTRVTNNAAPSIGGGIENHSGGVVTLTNSPVSDNAALAGGGLFNNGKLTLTNSPVTNNTAAEGGGLENSFVGEATLLNSPVTGNTADGEGGGGIFNDRGKLTVINSPLTANRAQPEASGFTRGGGLSISGGSVTLRNSPVSDNQAIGSTIGVGGGINIASVETLILENSPVTGNTASTDGGGIYSFSGMGTITFDDSPVQGNQPNDCVNVPGC